MSIVAKAKARRSDMVARKTFGVSRLSELLVVVKELTDNALDEAEEAGVAPVIQIVVEANSISVADQGRCIEPTVIGALVDYSIKTSSRATIVSPSRRQ
jgi:DNA topoisomerase VI subunit B